MDSLEGKVLFAIPKKGRLYEPSVALLERCDLKYRRKPRLDVACCTTLEVVVIFLPAADIPIYVSQGRVDLGITGQDVTKEAKAKVEELQELDFGKCQLCVQTPVNSGLTSPQQLAGKRVVTSFPHLTQMFFEKITPGNCPTVSFVSGSVEVACSLGLGDGVIDLVESGDTMRAAGLQKVAEIMSSQAVLISNPKSPHQEMIKLIASRVQGAVVAKRFVMVEYNILRADLPKAVAIARGQRSPTLSPLDDPDWVAAKVMVLRNDLGTILDKLKGIGALDIVVYDIINSRK